MLDSEVKLVSQNMPPQSHMNDANDIVLLNIVFHRLTDQVLAFKQN